MRIYLQNQNLKYMLKRDWFRYIKKLVEESRDAVTSKEISAGMDKLVATGKDGGMLR